MDSSDKDSKNNDMWEWEEEDYCLQRDSRNDFSQCLWDNVNVNEDSFMYMLDEQTPIKDCAGLGYQVYDVVDNASKGLECTETLQMKRRRMLQFTSDANEIGICNEQVHKGALINDELSENLEWSAQWNTRYQDDKCTFDHEAWDQAPQGWLANCLNESEMHCSLNEMDDCMLTDDPVDVPELCNASHEMETDLLQGRPNPSPIKIIRGGKSFLKTPKKLVTGVAYPFALIKPCGAQGDVTLKDINQRIHSPPSSISKQKLDEDPSTSYPTSAFSGKPVVLKTKIHTKGGRGSITIMRTKG